ncbi:MAG TPA: putative peptidoglycan glycosyltransferase FtsW [Candidatus Nanoarchaeia archaeon]|nr:putative peptidoglycan glycosyltransferase FtsW [Candidatus Nanoarchaeia archaeon]
MRQENRVDWWFLVAVIVMTAAGFFIFASASLGLFAREGARFASVAFSQTFFGLFLGSIACIITSKINYRFWRKYAFYIFILSILATLLVFVPGIGFSHGGAARWILVGPVSFQPSELLKIGFLIYIAAWISGVKKNVETVKYGILPFILLCGVVGAVLLSQPDTDTYVILCATALGMFAVSGGKWKHIAVTIFIALIGLSIVAYSRPYIRERLMVFINPSHDQLGSSYQLNQSLIAIGSGQWFGKGFGQSVQKFNFLPEPIGDSIFAVFAEEFGFVGSVGLIFLFVFFAFRGMRIAMNSPDTFGGLVAFGIVILIVVQSFVNIGAMLGVLPLSGIPLLFVSHGGSALFITLAEAGIVLNISRYQRSKHEKVKLT